MSAISYDSEDSNLPWSEMPPNQDGANAGCKASTLLSIQLSSQTNRSKSSQARDLFDATDDDLVTAAQLGDQRAFLELCGRYSVVTKKTIFRIVRNHEDAEDALQDTLLRAYLHLTSFRRSCKFSTWLTTIGVNSALMIMRKQRVRREINVSMSGLDTGTMEWLEPPDKSPGPEKNVLKQQVHLLMKREVEKLHPSLKSLVIQYYGSGCSLEEAARAQDISLAAAKARLQRGRLRLRRSLARYGISQSGN
jgi:RNA polymerase sigma-70 factor, ECF subfamily